MDSGKGNSQQYKAGDYYVVNEEGVLKKCSTDPDDDRRKLRVRGETHSRIVELQRSLRKSCGGHKPDLNLVAEALLLLGLNSENVASGTMEHCRNIFAQATSDIGSSA